MEEKEFIVNFSIGALVSIKTKATCVEELTNDEKDQLIREAVKIVDTPDRDNFDYIEEM